MKLRKPNGLKMQTRHTFIHRTKPSELEHSGLSQVLCKTCSSWCFCIVHTFIDSRFMFFEVCMFPVLHWTVRIPVERRSTRSIKVAKKPKPKLKKPKVVAKKPKLVKKTKAKVKAKVKAKAAVETVPRMYESYCSRDLCSMSSRHGSDRQIAPPASPWLKWLQTPNKRRSGCLKLSSGKQQTNLETICWCDATIRCTSDSRGSVWRQHILHVSSSNELTAAA